ncbi:MAG: DUF4870 domain-containing protein [Planctomycetota bacterium]
MPTMNAWNDQPAEPHVNEQGRFVDPSATEAERNWGMFTHLAGALAVFDGLGIVAMIVTPVLWRTKARQSPFLDDHGRDATNFQLSMLLYTLVGSAVVALFTLGLGLVPWLIAIAVVRLVGNIRGAMAANRGEYYRYPVCIRFFNEPVNAAA